MFANVTICVSFTGHIPIIAGVLSALVILLVVGVAFVCVHLKKQKNKPKGNEQYFPFPLNACFQCYQPFYITLSTKANKWILFTHLVYLGV